MIEKTIAIDGISVLITVSRHLDPKPFVEVSAKAITPADARGEWEEWTHLGGALIDENN